MFLNESVYIAAHSNTRIPDVSPNYDKSTVDVVSMAGIPAVGLFMTLAVSFPILLSLFTM